MKNPASKAGAARGLYAYSNADDTNCTTTGSRRARG